MFVLNKKNYTRQRPRGLNSNTFLDSSNRFVRRCKYSLPVSVVYSILAASSKSCAIEIIDSAFESNEFNNTNNNSKPRKSTYEHISISLAFEYQTANPV